MDASRRLPAKVLNDFSWWQPVFDLLDPNVRVPAGKQFYLYATQTIDKAKAVLGGTRLAKVVEEEAKAVDPLDPLRRQLIRRASPDAARPVPAAASEASAITPR
jgi:hypothetical protein